jgi:hypothetical protein
MRWIKLGEENTKFFHAMATQKYRRNYISQLYASDSHLATSHEEIASIAWRVIEEEWGLAMELTYSLIWLPCFRE